jgi:hypothetical protein
VNGWVQPFLKNINLAQNKFIWNRKFSVLVLLFIVSLHFGKHCLSQTDSVGTGNENKLFEKLKTGVYFNCGDSAWRKYLEKALGTSTSAKKKAPAGRYTVIAQYVLDKEGNISDVRAMTVNGYGMEEDVMRILKKGPRWEPAKQGGRTVKAYRKLSITFRIDKGKRKTRVIEDCSLN